MSTLLDVLHKRSPRTGEPDADATGSTAPAAREFHAPEATVELNLAADLEIGAGTTTLRHAAPLPAGAAEATADMTTMLRPPDVGDTTELRRWTDPPPAAPAPVTEAPKRGSLRPFALALGALLLVAVGYAAWQLGAPGGDEFLAPGTETPPPEPAAAVEEPVGPAPDALASVAAEPARPRAERALVPEPPRAAPADEPLPWYDLPALPEEAAEPVAEPLIRITRGSTPANPNLARLQEAHAALVAGDDLRAEPLYRAALAAEPTSVDALLGLASIGARAGRDAEAALHYRAVLRLDPRNPTALAALAALPEAAGRPGTESELKGMLREQPAAAALHFALGLRYVADQRWPDAQAAFFEALRHDPANADYAFNLAVSLDRLGQVRPAASYYRRALDLATGAGQFDAVAARNRLAALEAALATTP